MERSRGACQNVSEERGFPRGLMQKEKWKNCGNSKDIGYEINRLEIQ